MNVQRDRWYAWVKLPRNSGHRRTIFVLSKHLGGYYLGLPTDEERNAVFETEKDAKKALDSFIDFASNSRRYYMKSDIERAKLFVGTGKDLIVELVKEKMEG